MEEKKKIKIGLIPLVIIITVVSCIVIGGITYLIRKNETKKIYESTKNKYDENSYGENSCNENSYDENSLHKLITIEKPIIYLYPIKQTEITVKLGHPENITCSYPKYKQTGWKVLAQPNGSLTDLETGKNLYSLYWEGKNIKTYSKREEGFVIQGKDTAKFLEEKLLVLGLNQREAEEFIIYWLPKMENNKYNYIRFQTTKEINENMPLEITPKPDTTIRVMMEWKALDEYQEVKEQQLETPTRDGFVAVEWGGTEIN